MHEADFPNEFSRILHWTNQAFVQPSEAEDESLVVGQIEFHTQLGTRPATITHEGHVDEVDHTAAACARC